MPVGLASLVVVNLVGKVFGQADHISSTLNAFANHGFESLEVLLKVVCACGLDDADEGFV